MSITLYIFVTSERPDAYVNSIVHSALYLERDVRRVVFISVKGMDAKNPRKVSANTVAHNVSTLLDNLVQGNYIHLSGKQSGSVVSLREKYPEDKISTILSLYQKAFDIIGDGLDEPTVTVDYEALPELLADISHRTPNSIFDVTAVGKKVLGDILAISITEGLDEVYTFDSALVDYDNPWRMLIHELKELPEKPLYDYVNIVGTPIYKKCLASIRVNSASNNHKLVDSGDSRKYEAAVQRANREYQELQQNHEQMRRQSDGWYRFSLYTALFGFTLFGIGIIFAISGQTSTALVSVLAGVLPEVVAGLFFVQARAANKRADEIQRKLNDARELQAAVEIVNTIDDPSSRNKLKAEIVRKSLDLEHRGAK